VLEEGRLYLRNRWGEGPTLVPMYPDAFRMGGSMAIFRRDSSGRITEVTLSQGRVWDIRFRKM
jgi:hypothetical protein